MMVVALIVPCFLRAGSMTCPARITLAQIQANFNNIAPNANLGNVVINLPTGVKNIPSDFLGRNAANSITLVGATARALSQLTVYE